MLDVVHPKFDILFSYWIKILFISYSVQRSQHDVQPIFYCGDDLMRMLTLTADLAVVINLVWLKDAFS